MTVCYKEIINSSSVNEVIRALLNFFTKRFRAHKKTNTRHKPKPTNKARIKTPKRIKIVCFAFLRAGRKKVEKGEKSPQCKCTKYRCLHN